eukprot:TRINITY_DN2987_c0_g1_i1.p1 TRINITY_DN2987_c0_g1~~TRINITY_DN2987_c0_g1_i1.p1  ORF type:complete len:254 (+),score=29.23 TRINITY_DN2987_c0_g1_i1:64-825(+)
MCIRDRYQRRVHGDFMKSCVEEKRRSVWCKIPIGKSELIPFVVKHGFTFHHAETDFVMLTKWLAEGQSMLPSYVTHQVGVGGLVIREETKDILVIKEKTSEFAHLWKLPGGMVDNRESISEAARREVFEETGVETEFLSIVAFRDRERFRFEHSDIYFVALLKPKHSKIVPCALEVAESMWMPIEDFAKESLMPAQKRISDLTLFILRRVLEPGLSIKQEMGTFSFTPENFESIYQGKISKDTFYTANLFRNL